MKQPKSDKDDGGMRKSVDHDEQNTDVSSLSGRREGCTLGTTIETVNNNDVPTKRETEGDYDPDEKDDDMFMNKLLAERQYRHSNSHGENDDPAEKKTTDSTVQQDNSKGAPVVANTSIDVDTLEESEFDHDESEFMNKLLAERSRLAAASTASAERSLLKTTVTRMADDDDAGEERIVNSGVREVVASAGTRSNAHQGSRAAAPRVSHPGAHAVGGPGRPSSSASTTSNYQPGSGTESLVIGVGASQTQPNHHSQQTTSDAQLQMVPPNAADEENQMNMPPSLAEEEEEQEPIGGAVLVEEPMALAEQPAEVSGPEEEVIQGKILHEPDNNENRRAKQICLLAVILLVGSMAVILAFVLPPDNSSDGNATGTSTANSDADTDTNKPLVINPPFQEGLSNEVLAGIEELGSPHYKANAWVLEDPNYDSYTPEQRYQRFSMAWLYYIWNGQNWTRNDHWLSYDVPECEWFMHNSSTAVHGWHPGGDTLPSCDQEGKITALNLSSNNLQGYMPPSNTAALPELKIIDISDNNCSGFIPSIGDDAYKLDVFNIANNNFEGQLTGGASFSAFNLKIVKLNGNSLLGYLSPIYFLLRDLEYLDSSGNLFDGIIEPSLSQCKNLTYWRIADNLYSGPMPSEIGMLTALREIDVSGNAKVTGTLPTELGLLSDLALIDLSDTALEGTIPDVLCSRVEAGVLELVANCSLLECCS